MLFEAPIPQHLITPEAKDYDRFRQRSIEGLDIQFLRFTNRDIYQNIDGVIRTILQKVLALQT
ncbi:DUF559 domain-containing protein [Leptolyngbyaceae cyanobacterium CCMR0082]|uniref:DUF559 domain-containing protein n=1 Tax=Adonisia turfae CCMR0082 TaxID=2304604 RepID=A0A6M0S0Q7_9CYAN|nr:DUF559 domain-containing protein [Adonisia turfae CCMR0082]